MAVLAPPSAPFAGMELLNAAPKLGQQQQEQQEQKLKPSINPRHGGGVTVTVTAAAFAEPSSSPLPPASPAAAPPPLSPHTTTTATTIERFNYRQRRAACRAALDTLTAALADDPVNAYFSGAAGAARFVREEVRGYLKALPRASHFIATPGAHAVALWQLLPNETPRNELLAGLGRILRVPLRLWRHLLALELHYEAAHEAAAAAHGAYYYLSFIGTRPEARGAGYGSLLVRAITERADAERRHCLLEATSARSRDLYARHGFVTTEEYRVTPDAPPVFFMTRAPVAVAQVAAADAGTVTAAGSGSKAGDALSSALLKALAAEVADAAESVASDDFIAAVRSATPATPGRDGGGVATPISARTPRM